MKYWILAPLILALPLPASADVGRIAFGSDRAGNADIWSVNPDGSNPVNLTSTPSVGEEGPGWSPDGSKLAYQRADDIWYMNADGTGQTRIPIGHIPVHPTFRPNTDLLSYSRFGGYDHDIYTIEPDGTNETRIINNPYGDYCGRWNPDGSKITFYTFIVTSDSVPYIYVANADGSGQTRITTVGGDRNPSWSPDGGQIVFQSYRNGNEQIYIMNADGTGQTRLTNNTANDTSPVFSPDGRQIAFQSDRDGNFEIYVMNVDGTNQHNISNSSASDGWPTWAATLPAGAPSVSISDTTVTEGTGSNANATLTVTLSAPSASPVTVNYRTYDGTASAGSDYVGQPLTTLVFNPGETTKTLAIPVIGDSLDEDDENFSVRISAQGAKIADQEGVVTITDDDAASLLNIGGVTAAEGNSGTIPFNFVVSVVPVSGKPITVQYATQDGTAVAGSDYTAKTGTLTIPANTASGTIAIPVVGDQILEGNENFFVKLSNATNARIGQSLGRGTITNDDLKPSIVISDAAATEGGTAVFTVTTNKAIDRSATVAYTTADGTAKAGSDYTATSGVLTIPAGQTTATISVPILNDAISEVSETFLLNLSSPSNGIIVDGQGVGTITDDDPAGIYVSNIRQLEGSDGKRALYFTVSLQSPVPFSTSVDYATADGTAVAGADYTATSGTVTFSPNETSKPVVVLIQGDLDLEADEDFFLNLSNPVRAVIIRPQGKATLVNDDTEVQP